MYSKYKYLQPDGIIYLLIDEFIHNLLLIPSQP